MLLAVLGVLFSTGCLALAVSTDKPRVLFINSYDIGYPWSDGVFAGVCSAFHAYKTDSGRLDCSSSKVLLRSVEMNARQCENEKCLQRAGARVMHVVRQWRPDYIIASDDYAAKYVVADYMPLADVPVIFCGVDWDASKYGFPRHNVTGMVEVSLLSNLLKSLKSVARGDRVGVIYHDERATAVARSRVDDFAASDIVWAKAESFDQWKEVFIRLQSEADIVLLGEAISDRPDWNPEAAMKHAALHTKVPTGTTSRAMTPYALMSYVKRPQEQGRYAADVVLRLLDGESIDDIALVRNKTARIYLNMKLAKRLGIIFPMNIVDQAFFVGD